MNKSFLKIIIASALLFLVVSAVAYVAFTVNTPEAEAAGSCGSCGDDPGPSPDPSPDPGPFPDPIVPVCVISANPASITAGDSTTLTWTTTNAVSASLNQGIGSVAVGSNKSRVVSPDGTITYVMTVTSSDGNTDSCSTSVTVVPPSVPLPYCVIDANPGAVLHGDTTTLTWSTYNAATARINQGIGAVAIGTNKSKSVTPPGYVTYVMTVTNADGNQATCSTTVDTLTPVPPVPPTPAPYCEINANPRVVLHGDPTTLTWTTHNAATARINQGIGAVAIGTNKSKSVTPPGYVTYVMTVTNAAGDQATCSTTVDTLTPVPPTPHFTCENNVSFFASPSRIEKGDSSTLTWSTTGVVSVYFTGISATTLNGSVTVSPDSDTTYTLHASNGSRTISCPVTVDVYTNGGGGGGGGYIVPRCEIEASVTNVNSGGAVKLSWFSRNAEDIIVEDDRGNILVDSHGKRSSVVDDLLNDDITVYPTRDTTYTVTVTRGSRDRDCSVEVEINDNLIVQQIRNQQPIVTGISLTEVPYTGFEAGPFMTLVFYMLLVLWALYLAYVLVLRRNPSFAVVGNNNEVPLADLGQKIQPASFVADTATPNFHVSASDVAVPAGVQYGYGGVVNDEEANKVENVAHASHVLFSGDAMRNFMETTNSDNRMNALEKILDEAKASYPTEDGWVVINEERLAEVCKTCFSNKSAVETTSFTPNTETVGNSSLAEAIVTGNIVAAYQMIGNRPMIALADTAADLDALYRAKQGADVTVSKLLAHSDVKTEQLHNAIAALTGALDGTYTDEAEAVKMAIMKAVKAIHG